MRISLVFLLPLLFACFGPGRPTIVIDNYYKTTGSMFYFYLGMPGKEVNGKIIICDEKCQWYKSSLWYCGVSDQHTDTIDIAGQLFGARAAIMSYSDIPYLDGNEKAGYVSYSFKPIDKPLEIEVFFKVKRLFVEFQLKSVNTTFTQVSGMPTR